MARSQRLAPNGLSGVSPQKLRAHTAELSPSAPRLAVARELGVTETVAQQAHRDCRACRRAISPLKEFGYIDVGTMPPNSGAVPVVIRSLIFPANAAPGMEWQGAPRVMAG